MSKKNRQQRPAWQAPAQLTLLSLALLPGIGMAIVIDGAAISGLPPNTVVELDLGLDEPSTATTNANGEVTITEEDDDDSGTLYIPTGVDGTWQMRTEKGVLLGSLRVSGPSVTVASSITPAFEPSSRWQPKVFVNISGDFLTIDDIANNTAAGAALAEQDGFSVTRAADDDTFGPGIGIGLLFGSDNYIQGTWQGEVGIHYTHYDDMRGEFTASQQGVTLRSAGQSEISTWGLNVGARFFVADRLGLYGGLSYQNVDFSDSGSIVWVETNTELSSFDESRDDDLFAASLGLSYHFNDTFSFDVRYQRGFSEVGASETDDVEQFVGTLRTTFDF